eukprot:Lithocolla_globosa_v1_NODE_608_length_3609_cov_12.400675.p1 type:complete len:501 gc:universal NODE_608_length_3609_cov_12.400675:3307-1805(-)
MVSVLIYLFIKHRQGHRRPLMMTRLPSSLSIGSMAEMHPNRPPKPDFPVPDEYEEKAGSSSSSSSHPYDGLFGGSSGFINADEEDESGQFIEAELMGTIAYIVQQHLETSDVISKCQSSNLSIYQVFAQICCLVYKTIKETDENIFFSKNIFGLLLYNKREVLNLIQNSFQNISQQIIFDLTNQEEKEVPHLDFTFSMAEDQGPRPKMEDKIIMFPFSNQFFEKSKFCHIFGIFDGHGGPEAAAYLGKHLIYSLLTDQNFDDEPELALKNSFLSVNENLFNTRDFIPPSAGSTGLIALIFQKKIYIAWCGDTEALLITKEKDDPTSDNNNDNNNTNRDNVIECCRPLHKASDPDEQERINRKGGTVMNLRGQWRVMGALAVSRAFGNVRYRHCLDSEPDISCYTLDGTEEYLVLACDGLWDVMTGQEVNDFIREHSEKPIKTLTRQLVLHARKKGSTDNISAVIIKFDEKKKIKSNGDNDDGGGDDDGDDGDDGDGGKRI